MQVFVEDDWNSQFRSVEEFMRETGATEGDTFELTKVEVVAKTTYRITGGKACPVAMCFAVDVGDHG